MRVRFFITCHLLANFITVFDWWLNIEPAFVFKATKTELNKKGSCFHSVWEEEEMKIFDSIGTIRPVTNEFQ